MSRGSRVLSGTILVFALEDLRCALYLSSVDRVVRAVDVTPLPKAPEIVLGVINAQGRIIPVIDVRKRFRLPEREIRLEDRFVLASARQRRVALAVDSVEGVRGLSANEAADSDSAFAYAEYLKGIAKTKDGLILIYDLDSFLSLEEERELDASLSEARG